MAEKQNLLSPYKKLVVGLKNHMREHIKKNVQSSEKKILIPGISCQDAENFLREFKRNTLEGFVKFLRWYEGEPHSGSHIRLSSFSQPYVTETIRDFFENKHYEPYAKMRIGVVGYCPPSKFDENKAKEFIKDAYTNIIMTYDDLEKTVVSGLVNVGVSKIAYEAAKKLFLKTAGVACKKAYDFKDNWFPVDEELVIIGEKWGDESKYFVNSIDALVRIGGGEQSRTEAQMAKRLGKPVFEYELEKLDEKTTSIN